MEEKKPSYTVVQPYGKQHGGSLKKLNTELSCDPAIPLLGIYLEKTIIQKDTSTPIFMAALFTSLGNNPDVHLSWKDKDVVCTHSGILLTLKKE